MKTVLLSLITLIACTFTQTAAAQKKVVQKAVISTPDVQDEACKDRIDKYLSREYGVSSVNTNYRRHTVTVQWFTNRTNIENIKTAIANLGYDADDVTADPDAYKRLPKTCQHKVEKLPSDSTKS